MREDTYSKKRNTLSPINNPPQLTRSIILFALFQKTNKQRKRSNSPRYIADTDSFKQFIFPYCLQEAMIDTIFSKTQTNKKRIAINPCHSQKVSSTIPLASKKRIIFVLFPKLKQRNKRVE